MIEPICKNCGHWHIWWTYCPFGDCAKQPLEIGEVRLSNTVQTNELDSCINYEDRTTPEKNNDLQMPLF